MKTEVWIGKDRHMFSVDGEFWSADSLARVRPKFACGIYGVVYHSNGGSRKNARDSLCSQCVHRLTQETGVCEKPLEYEEI